ncbi:amidohydrolase family protein [Pseudidiomarina insulisalsae]|uniref:Amidohydrolase n=1 Tax=Pseudidiomarina insulisalsae TaxID=575789 RepID=A0A432YHZ1_9GAMM|nr:amidohydrolase family protein [Pseudidiomarina insulisalsae]RUO60576.1 amidohydrolase [Pseudidiomarina insulisalsae]
MKKLITAVAAATVSLSVAAHDIVPGEPQQQPILLQNGTLHTVSHGVQANTDLLFVDGKITAIGVDLAVPANAQVLDVAGKHVYPGVIALDTTIGLREIESVRATEDADEAGVITPEVSGHVAYNPDSEVIPTIRYNGVSHAQIVPQGELITGRSSLLQLDGWTYEDAGERLNVGVHVNWPRVGINTAWWERRSPAEQRKANAEARKQLERTFIDAKAYYDAKQAGELNGTDLRWEAMLGLFDGSSTLFVHADDQRQIEEAIELTREWGFDWVLMGARDAWRMADQLAAENVRVVYGAPFGLPTRHDEAYDQAFSTPAALAQAGVNFAISYPGYWDVRNLPFAAGNAVAYGLDREQALAAITLKPAEFLGVADRLGSLEEGKQATILISDGDLLDPIGQKIEQLFIEGRLVDLNNRHLQLYNKYKQKP